MGRFTAYVDSVKKSRLLAPNLREATLKIYTGNAHPGNHIGRYIIKNHLLALRWMNPNAVIYLKEIKGQGTPELLYELWDGKKKAFEIKDMTPEETLAKLMMAARDPADDVPSSSSSAAAPAAAAGSGASAGVSPAAAAAAAAAGGAGRATPAGARAFSTVAAGRSIAEGAGSGEAGAAAEPALR